MAAISKDTMLEDLLNSYDVKGYSYFHNLLDNRTIVLDDSIGDGFLHSFTMPLLEMDNDGSGKPITIVINSVGGDVIEALSACNVIENLKTKTTIIVQSYAFSMAFLMTLAGHNNPNVKTICYPFSAFMVHTGSIKFEGTEGEVNSFHQFNSDLKKRIKEYAVSHSNMTPEQYDAKNTDAGTWFLGDEALKLGIVDEVIGSEKERN